MKHHRDSRLLTLVAWLLSCAVAGPCWANAPTEEFIDAAAAPAETPLERAFRLDEGMKVARDRAAAAVLYREAADQGDAFAHLRLGYLAETGDGVPQDYSAARAHYQFAADAGLKEARLRLAICHLEGWGGPVDRAAFARDVRAAAEADYVPAQHILAGMYFTGFAVPTDRAEGVRWLERAAALDDPDAQLRLGIHSEHARRMALMPDVTLARNWYQLSAEQEYHAAMRALARTFLTGPRDERNWQLGQRWLALASEGGDAEAPFILAVCELLHVDAPRPDLQQARAWLELASSRGNARATEMLELEKTGRPLADAAHYVLNVPFDQRYIQRLAVKDPAAPTHPPQLFRLVHPVYPESLRMMDTTGDVLIEFVVDTTGRVAEAQAVESPHPLFSERAIEAVKQWRFHPAKRDGRVVNVRMRVPINFKLADEQVQGVDGILAHAVGRARQLGPAVLADTTELGIAKPFGPVPRPRHVTNGATPDGYAMILLVLDESGRPIRGHVLHSTPEPFGVELLEAALAHRYEPRIVNGEAVSANVLLLAGSKPPAPVFRK